MTTNNVPQQRRFTIVCDLPPTRHYRDHWTQLPDTIHVSQLPLVNVLLILLDAALNGHFDEEADDASA